MPLFISSDTALQVFAVVGFLSLFASIKGGRKQFAIGGGSSFVLWLFALFASATPIDQIYANVENSVLPDLVEIVIVVVMAIMVIWGFHELYDQ